MKKSEESQHKLWDTSERSSLFIMRFPEEKRGRKMQKERNVGRLFKEVMAENFPKSWIILDTQFHEFHNPFLIST